MSIKSRLFKARRTLGRFRRAQQGNVAITFGFTMLPLICFVGAAIDYTRANSVKASLQAALDTTALMLSKEASTDTNGQLQSSAQKFFSAMFIRPEAQNAVVTASYSTSGGSTVVVNGTVSVPTVFMGVIGYNSIDVTSSSTAKWGSTYLRVALALDNTGSMSQAGKMTALKTATKNLLGQLQTAAGTNGDVYVSIIPFNKDVNVGSANYNGNWIDWSSWEGDTNNQTCSEDDEHEDDDHHSASGHDDHHGDDHHGDDHHGDDDDHDDDDDDGHKTCQAKSHSTWNGCITDRGNSAAPGSTPGYDQNVDPPNPSIKASLFPAEQYSSCPVPMMGLNYNWSAMNSLVDQMQPKGSTNQPIGLVWGWQSLVGGGPLTAPAKNPGNTYQDVIILISDGLNTQDRWYQAQTPVNNRMYQNGNGSGTCANIKAAGVTIYTIQVNTDGDPTSALLQNCASSSAKFYLLTSASQIISAFNAIGTSLTQLRVAK